MVHIILSKDSIDRKIKEEYRRRRSKSREQGTVDEQVKRDYETRKMIRKQEDKLYHGSVFGRSKDTPSRGDYRFCKEGDKYLDAIRRFPKDRDKISREYHAWMRSQRKYGSKGV